MKYGKIICDPNSEEAKALIGKRVIGADCYDTLCKDVYIADGELTEIEETQSSPFCIDDYEYDARCTFIREVIEDDPKYRPYKNCEEMIDDFCKRFRLSKLDFTMPFIWLKSISGGTVELITTFRECSLNTGNAFTTLNLVFKDYTYVDGSPVGKEVSQDE